jgi:hypothetical protein
MFANNIQVLRCTSMYLFNIISLAIEESSASPLRVACRSSIRTDYLPNPIAYSVYAVALRR